MLSPHSKESFYSSNARDCENEKLITKGLAYPQYVDREACDKLQGGYPITG